MTERAMAAEKANRKTRNGEIDLLRFGFSIIILLFHYGRLLPQTYFARGEIAVEFFFVVAGIFMAKHAKTIVDQGRTESIGNTTWTYIIRRVSSFFAYYLVAFILCTVFWRILAKGTNPKNLPTNILQCGPTISLTFMGLNNNVRALYVPNTWYLSALLIASFVLFPCMLYKFDASTKIIFPLASMGILGWLYAENKTIIVEWQNWSGFLYHGVIRAIAEMALGASLFSLIEWIRRRGIDYSGGRKAILTGIKWICFGIVVFYALTSKLKTEFSIHALLYCCVGIVLSLSDITYNIPSTKMSRYLNRCSLPIYLFHGFVTYILEKRIESGCLTMTPVLFVVVSVASVIGSVILMHGTDYVVKLIRTRKRRTPAAETGTEKE